MDEKGLTKFLEKYLGNDILVDEMQKKRNQTFSFLKFDTTERKS